MSGGLIYLALAPILLYLELLDRSPFWRRVRLAAVTPLVLA
jgi:hypothetical protein